MDPIHRGPEDFGRDNDGYGEESGRRTQPRAPLTSDFGQQPMQRARVVQVVSGDFLLTVNPVDGSEVELCPPGEQPPVPVRRTAAERTDRERAAAPPVPPGPPAPQLPLLERQEERERLVRLLARGRSVRLTGPAGSGRTALLSAVAADCADLAPDGVVRLSGLKRTVTDLLYGLFEAVYDAPLLRPDRAVLLEMLRSIGAVVVLDDLEFGGAALDELLDATPECAFLFATTPDVPAPTADAHLEEVFLAGLGRSASVALLEEVAERPLTDDEANWAGDLWFESEGLPLRFVQAGALLRRRDMLRTDPTAYDEQGYVEGRPVDDVFAKGADAEGQDAPLPSLGEGAAPAALLASRLSGPARDTLHFAVALGGEVPHQAHLPALVGDTHADAALGELAGCGLLSPAGSRYRLAPGVVAQLEAAGYGEDADDRARTAAQHYAWWAGHSSVTAARAVAEADAIVAAMTRLVPGDGAGQASAAVLLARSAAPALAAGLHWSGWEKTLRLGQEAARIAGEVAEEAYFHHELGVLALCNGNPDRARAELETSISMRGALADKSGAVAGRRALALVADRSGTLPGGRTPVGEEVPAARYDESASPPGGIPAAGPMVLPWMSEDDTALISRAPASGTDGFGGRKAVLGGARRNLVAAGAGVLLAAVLGTVVTLGMMPSSDAQDGGSVSTEQSAGEDDSENGLPADEPADDSTPGGASSSGSPSTPGPSGSQVSPSGSGAPSSESSGPSDSPSSGRPASGRPSSPGTPTKSPTDTSTKTPTKTATPTPTETETTGSPTPAETPTDTTSPGASDSASGPSTTASASGSSPEPVVA
ncbi:ATP-binding protein [Streptomyces sp. NBC_00842]|uniref:ATP-binding protein n=1 Tax=Streptomyces sp. NBC_00842 TaxID=2975848 RepID=UPI0038658015|nr:ATP-binding protein [Streptomyces sp. NBC_00842]